MKKSTLLLLATGGLLLVSAGSGYVGWFTGIHSQAISHEVATGLALSKIGEGTARTARLARSHGMPVWELNFGHPNDPGITEVCVHALTGEIVAVRQESLQKADRELAKVAKHLGITAGHLSTKAGGKVVSAGPAEKTEPPEPGSNERIDTPPPAPSATDSNHLDNPEK